MLGHKLYQVLAPIFDVTGAVREPPSNTSRYDFFQQSRIVHGVDAREISTVERVIEGTSPAVVINAIGIVKQMENRAGPLLNIWVNSLFPHQLYQICQGRAIRLIHISTDCVFSGGKGRYREDDLSDAQDVYGKSKYLGEVEGDGALTIRTSLIGRELVSTRGLLEWFLANEGGRIKGFTNAIFSGFPSLHLARIIADAIADHRYLHGVYHVSSEPISKFSLLSSIKRAMGLNIEIEESPEVRCDRSLDSTLYRKETGFAPLPWDEMIDELAQDAEQYWKWRQGEF